MSDRPSLLTNVPLDMQRGMPRSDDAEKGALSCFLNRPEELLGHAATNLAPECFYHAGNRLLFEEMLAFQNQLPSRPLDNVLFSQWLIDRGLMDKIGGPGFLSELLDHVLTPAHYTYYVGILKDKLLLRQIIAACLDGIQRTYEHEEDPGNILALISTKMIELEQHGAQKFRSMPNLIQDALTRYDEAVRLGGKLPGISTGYPRLDAATGGLMKGDLWVVAGGTSDGKTALAQCILHNVCRAGCPASLHTFEMSDEKTVDRFFCINSKIPNHVFKRGLFDAMDYSNLTRTAEALNKFPLYIRDVSGMKLSALLADMRMLHRKHKVKVFVVDYGQLIRADSKGHNRENEVALMSSSLKGIAKSMKVTVIVLSQLNDDGKLRESRAIGYDGDIVGTLSLPEIEGTEDGEKDESRRIFHFGKNRDGERGLSIPYHFNGPTFTFTEEKTEHEPS